MPCSLTSNSPSSSGSSYTGRCCFTAQCCARPPVTAARVRAGGRYAAVTVCFMDLNKPSIPDAIDSMAARGISQMIAAPYFLQLGNHVKDDLPLSDRVFQCVKCGRALDRDQNAALNLRSAGLARSDACGPEGAGGRNDTAAKPYRDEAGTKPCTQL